ncbi:MAG: NAD(P)-dependent oxidoreductase [Patescibacteria group bacterium]
MKERQVLLLNGLGRPDWSGSNCDFVTAGPEMVLERVVGIMVRSAPVDIGLYPSLQGVARAGSGTDNIPVAAATERGIPVFNAPGANAQSVAELLFVLLGMALRKVVPALQFVSGLAGKTADEMKKEVEKGKKAFAGRELRGQTLGVVGLGQVGIAVANQAVALGMQVVACDPGLTTANALRLVPGVTLLPLEEVAAKAAILTVHVPLNAATKGLLGSKVLSAFGGSFIANLSRAGVVDEKTIVAMLDADQNLCYITDFATPGVVGHPGVICTPHLGASTQESEDRCAKMASDTLYEWLHWGVVRNSVNFPSAGSSPAANVKQRLTALHHDQPGVLAFLTSKVAEAGGNISAVVNQGNGQTAVTVLDLASETIPHLDAMIREMLDGNEAVLGIHGLEF